MTARSLAHCPIYLAPAVKGSVMLGRTVPSLLYEGCKVAQNKRHRAALCQWTYQGWQRWSFDTFRTAAEELALGLGLWALPAAARIALFLRSDVTFALADMACLLAGFVSVPIEPSQPIAETRFMLEDSEASAVVVSDWGLLKRLLQGQLPDTVKLVVVGAVGTPPEAVSQIFPASVSVLTINQLRQRGQQSHSPKHVQQLRQGIQAQDLATIVYTADAAGTLKGVMLTHENLSADIWAAFSSMPKLTLGHPETALSFLPLNHIFARAFLYGHYRYGHTIYFSMPKRVMKHLREVKPTIFITVPRLLEKVYEQIQSTATRTRGLRGRVLRWGWRLAQQYETSEATGLGYGLQLWVARRLMFRQVRAVFGGRLQYFICGGAALKADIFRSFHGLGLPIKQGYGLTETSSVLSYTRDRWSQPGTVGAPIPGVEMRLAADGEVLVKSPYTMQGYYHNPEATQAVIDADGWFHTGDYGEFSEGGLLRLLGCKKELFKLSTGKYVAPKPIEARLRRSSLVRRAIVVGPQRKFCGALIFPEISSLEMAAAVLGLQLPREGLLSHALLLARYQQLIDQVNALFPHWSTVKRFALLNPQQMEAPLAELIENRHVNRAELYQALISQIDGLYREREKVPRVESSRRVTLRTDKLALVQTDSSALARTLRLLNPLRVFAN
ncbi:MAG: AMP-binding protein [Cyanobacteria bacterium P01_D01_bin.44]